MQNRPPELDCALRAVAEACSVTRRVQSDLDQIRQLTKDDRSPVTVADFAAQAIVAMRLNNDLGAISLVGEESAADLRSQTQGDLPGAITDAVRSVRPAMTDAQVLDAIDLGNHDASDASYWTLDPVDGTKGFLRRGQYAVALALIEDGVVTMGVLGCTNLSPDFARSFDDPDPVGCIFYASAGSGAWMLPANDIGTAATPISAASEVALDALRVCESVEASHSKQDDTARIIEYLKATSRPARLDSQCKYAVIARGQADAYLRLPTRAAYVEKIWDHAAGKLVAEEAGATVTDIYGRALDFSKGATLSANKGVVCTAQGVHTRIIEAIEALGIAP
jgi:HAL2 family 3'(2'),5'-bisphosphate nucleotidase